MSSKNVSNRLLIFVLLSMKYDDGSLTHYYTHSSFIVEAQTPHHFPTTRNGEPLDSDAFLKLGDAALTFCSCANIDCVLILLLLIIIILSITLKLFHTAKLLKLLLTKCFRHIQETGMHQHNQALNQPSERLAQSQTHSTIYTPS